MKTVRVPLAAVCRKALVAGAVLGCFATVASAEDASVLINSFSYVTSGGTTLTWNNPDQSFYANAQDGGGVFGSKTDSFETGDYNFAIAGATTTNADAAISTTTPQTFWATASTTPSTHPGGTPPNQATADAFQSGDFSLSAPGTVTFIIDYTLGASKPGGNMLTDFASAMLNFNVSLPGRQSVGGGSDQLFSFDQLSGIGNKSGEFTVNVSLLEDQVASYTLEGTAQSFAVAVPEPQEWALMAAGLMVLSTVARRRMKDRG